ncbi:hypothetical protein [Nocardioides jishulii]|uniref:Uncharacterized protein n=1 Tax=Nocardioides jishulii TaxID=2575440 RepID=A0A4U2YR19_9ACTN|nr:hypothetical protein [Nocardioides jishulii]QCX26346.1 hypothetical protein FCL41_01400 [Nocardioides jishulii]TKI63849.1 hypothetical protein FC770_01305 [Nocardioides jishulii]
MENSRALRRAMVLVVSCVVLALLVVTALVWWEVRAPQARVVDDGVDPGGWKTLAYEGVEVDVPASWERLDMGDCGFSVERWAPPGTDPCAPDAAGVAFYGSALFDPVMGPDVARHSEEAVAGADWSGYADADEFAVNVTAGDKATVQRILDSAE